MKPFLIAMAAGALCLPGIAQAQSKAEVVSRGARFEIKMILKEENTTVVLFLQDTSVMEQQFLADLEKKLPKGEKIVLDLVRLKDINAPAAVQYEVNATPTAI